MIAALTLLACTSAPPASTPPELGFEWRGGAGRASGAGRNLSLGDVDGDGCDEAFVKSDRKGWIVPYHPHDADLEDIATSFMDEQDGIYGSTEPGGVSPAGDANGDGTMDLDTSRGLLLGEAPLPNNLAFGLQRLDVPEGWLSCNANGDAWTDFCDGPRVRLGPADDGDPWEPDLAFVPEEGFSRILHVVPPGEGPRWLLLGNHTGRLLTLPEAGTAPTEAELLDRTFSSEPGSSLQLVERSHSLVARAATDIVVRVSAGPGADVRYPVIRGSSDGPLDDGSLIVVTPSDWRRAGLADVDDDGLDDLLVAYREGYGEDAFLDVFLAPFDGPRDRDAPDLRLGPTTDDLAAGDMDCDGRDDLLVGRAGLVRLIPGVELGELLDAALYADDLPAGKLWR